MNVTEKWGDNVDSAVELALAELKLTREEVDVTVLEEPSRGFFGIGSRLALVRVEKKKTEPAVEVKEEPVKVEVSEKKEAKAKKEKASKVDKMTKEQKVSPHKEVVSENQPDKESELNREIKNLPVCEEHPAKEFLREVTEQMGLNLDLRVKADDSNVYVEISGEDSGTIIGKRGQTLDAIQYLTSLVVNKDKSNYIKVVVDAEDYRSRREQTLEKLANRLAGKVVRSKRMVKLEPMNPYERKVIHATLQGNSRVTTRSEGQDPYRRVIIELK